MISDINTCFDKCALVSRRQVHNPSICMPNISAFANLPVFVAFQCIAACVKVIIQPRASLVDLIEASTTS